MKKVLIVNEGFSHNLGDQAIMKSTISFYEDKGFAVEFVYLSKPSFRSLPIYDYKNTKSTPPKNKGLFFKIKASLAIFYWYIVNRGTLIQLLKNNRFEIISIGGGQLINGSGTNFPSQFAVALFWLTRLFKAYSKNSKVFFIGVGLGTKFNLLEKKYYSSALENANGIWVRDEFSKDTLAKVFKLKSKVIPDIAFYIGKGQIKEYEKENIALVGIANFEEVVIRYDPTANKETYYKEIYDEIIKFENRRMEVKLFYTTLLDVVAAKELNNYLVSKNHKKLTICAINTLEDLLLEIKKSKVVYSGRMHALILGLKYRCEIKPYLLSQKLKSFQELYIEKKVSNTQLSKDIEKGLEPLFIT